MSHAAATRAPAVLPAAMAAAVSPPAATLQPSALAPVAPELRGAVAAALLSFFGAGGHGGMADGPFARGGPVERAETLASYLCGAGEEESSGRSAELLGGEAPPNRGQRRVLLTGCFDIMHAGHFNALRQARTVFPGENVVLVAGIHSDAAIEEAKGAPTVLKHAERAALLRACRWVDEVVGELPYAVPVSLLDRLGCDVAVHGDDLPSGPGGGGLFDEVAAAGRLRIVKRTEGTSTTTLIGKLLSASKERRDAPAPGDAEQAAGGGPQPTLLATMSRLAQFYGERARAMPGSDRRVVYAPGSWDLFHVGHVHLLARARALGDFVVVGVHDDQVVHRRRGAGRPLQSLHERALNVSACRHVDDVVLGAPWRVTRDLITSLNVSIVALGRTSRHARGVAAAAAGHRGELLEEEGDPLAEARAAGVLRILESECTLTVDNIADRVLGNVARYNTRQIAKESAELDYNATKQFVAES